MTSKIDQEASELAKNEAAQKTGSSTIRELTSKLREIFQVDAVDLDFGVYRILRQRHDEIVRFLEEDLPSKVKEAFARYESADKAMIEKQLQEAIKAAEALGADPEATGKVKELRQKLSASVDRASLENEVYSALCSFFSRYYKEGDFISQRRYKEGMYSIPYEGEEVKLYWANHDQYYIKTSEYFHNYVFNLPSGKAVRFEISTPSKEEQRSVAGKSENRFFLVDKNPVHIDGNRLVIRFEFRPDPDRARQEDINKKTIEQISSLPDLQDWRQELLAKSSSISGKEGSVLEKHLSSYTARNTFDYFIHKDLGTFLRRELDFFIKTEIVQLDDIENLSTEKLDHYLSKVRVIREIAEKVISFLTQIEDFQKKLWLKKKFVVEANYCLTLDRIPEHLYPLIAKNESQRQEWSRLVPLGKGESTLSEQGYPKPLTAEFLKEHQYLVVDTRHFDQDFKLSLLSQLSDLEDELDGVAIQGDNFHALRLLRHRFQGKVDCVYIDPPFNTEATEILYKNNYKHSSWLSLLHDRVNESINLMNDDSIICVAIDDFELPGLEYCLESLLGEEHHLAIVAVRSNPHGRAMASGFSRNHEYALFFATTDRATIGRLPRSEKKRARYANSDEQGIYTWINFRKTGVGSRRTERRKLYYPIFVSEKGKIRIPPMKWSESLQVWEPTEHELPNETIVLPIDENNEERVWNTGWARAQMELQFGNILARKNGGWQVYRKYRPHQEGAVPTTWWEDAKYSATESGTKILKELFGERESFTFPKSVYLVEDCLRASNCSLESWVLDFFAGSGTAAHAVINLNREDGGRRKYVVVEIEDYFDKVTLPRIKKAVFASEWEEGRPVNRKGISHAFKYIRLGSYDDTLDNIELTRSDHQQTLLDRDTRAREEYLLTYMLDFEASGSASLLNTKAFENPFDYKLKVTRSGMTRTVNVDLTETFNYLLGLEVTRIRAIDHLITVEGVNPEGKKVLVLWRNAKEISSDALDEWFKKQGYNSKDQEFDIIYVNGDNNLENLRPPEQTWQAKLTEEAFHKLMFQDDEA